MPRQAMVLHSTKAWRAWVGKLRPSLSASPVLSVAIHHPHSGCSAEVPAGLRPEGSQPLHGPSGPSTRRTGEAKADIWEFLDQVSRTTTEISYGKSRKDSLMGAEFGRMLSACPVSWSVCELGLGYANCSPSSVFCSLILAFQITSAHPQFLDFGLVS